MGMLRIGIFMMAIFTAAWSAWAWPVPDPLVRVPGIAFGIAAVALAIFGLLRGRGGRAGRGPSQSTGNASLDDAHRPDQGRGAGKTTLIAILVEVVAIFAVVRWLGTVNPDLIQPAIALIVGAHFLVFQFNPATRGGVHVVTTVFGVTVGAIGLLMIHGDRPPELVHALVGLGMAAITLSYGVLFARAMRTANGTGKGADRLSARAEP